MSGCKGNCAGTCGCCSGTQASTPVRVENRPGLSAIRYRVGEHASFKSTLLARLSSAKLAALRQLRTRGDDDFTIALLDSFSTMADVLTFYQERIANESYLRTAVERRSVLELARLIGYELRPGVAAETQLAFTIEDTPGAFLRAANPAAPFANTAPEAAPIVALGAGTKVQSIPGPGETAQMFETVEAMKARAAWNAIRPRLTKPQTIAATTGSVYLTGINLDVKKGDRVVTFPSPTLRIVEAVTTDPPNNLTRVDFSNSPLTTIGQPAVVDPVPGLFSWLDPWLSGPLTPFAVAIVAAIQWREADLSTIAAREKWDTEELMTAVGKLTSPATEGGAGMAVFRQRGAAFGHTAPKWDSLPASLRFRTRARQVNADGTLGGFQVIDAAYPSPGWENDTLETDASPSGSLRSVYLDHQYEQIAVGGWVGFETDGAQRVASIAKVEQLSRSKYTISGKTTRVRVIAEGGLSAFRIRETTIHVQSESLPLAPLPITDAVSGSTIVCDRMLLGVRVGQVVAISGERADVAGAWISEALEIVESNIDRGLSVLKFKSSLTYPLVRKTVTINANVARATHGETVNEILGAGDAAQPFQRFTLRQPPLTHVSADTDTGTASTLEVRVNDLLWEEVPSFYGHGPNERIYITRLDDDGNTTVVLGDGRTGARLPTGENNVTAKYRRGIGSAGLVKANQISQLMSRPLGLKGASNPVASQNAGDREPLSEARRNASLTALTLGRVVSLRDYEDFSRAFAGIAKADATWAWSGERRHVLVTVAGPNGSTVVSGSELHKNLIAALRKFGDPHTPVHLVSYVPRLFRLQAKIKVSPEYLREKVFEDVETRLREAFSFDARSFGQAVGFSEVVAVMHRADGVIAVDVDEFCPTEQEVPDVKPRIGAVRPSAMAPARLVTIDPRPVKLGVMT